MSLFRSPFRGVLSPSVLPAIGAVGGAEVEEPPPLLVDLVAYYDLDEASGDREDSHINGLDLTDVNTVTSADGVGEGQTAALFTSANSEQLTRAGGSDLGGNETGWSLCCWIYGTADSGLREDFLTTFNSNAGYIVRVPWDGSNQLNFGFGTGSAFVGANLGPALSAETWYFIYCEHNGTSGKASVNDGTLTTVATADYGPSSATFRVGNGPFNNYWNGRIQALGFWNRILTSDEITWLYNSGTAARLYADVAAYTG